jgi:hypothetical protein
MMTKFNTSESGLDLTCEGVLIPHQQTFRFDYLPSLRNELDQAIQQILAPDDTSVAKLN